MFAAQVIVAGAGPVGTMAAYLLAQNGIDVIVCEAGPDCAHDLRASTFHPPTLEMMEEIGAVQALLDHGLKAPIYQFMDRQTGDVFDFDVSELSDMTRFPYRIQCEQFVMARSVAKLLEEHPRAEMRFNNRIVHFEQDDEGVTVAVETPLAVEKLRCRYLIAADGASSIVRKWLGVEFDGFTYPEKFLCVSTEYPLESKIPSLSHVNYVSDPEEWMVLLRVPSVWRILVPAQADKTDQELVSNSYVEGIFDRLIGKTDVETRHRTIYRVHQRVATRFRFDRVCLVGDAAHLNSPLGGFGMNSGIHDAWNLGHKLIGILKNGEHPDILDRFDRQRRAVTHSFIQAQTIENMRMMREGLAEGRSQRREEMRRIKSDPKLRRDYLKRQAMFQSLEQASQVE